MTWSVGNETRRRLKAEAADLRARALTARMTGDPDTAEVLQARLAVVESELAGIEARGEGRKRRRKGRRVA